MKDLIESFLTFTRTNMQFHYLSVIQSKMKHIQWKEALHMKKKLQKGGRQLISTPFSV